jgi:hypothetical protein
MASSFFRRWAFAPSLTLMALTVAVLLGLAGCHPAVTDPKDPKFIVAEKGNWTITRGELNDEIAKFMQANPEIAQQIGPAQIPLLETKTLKGMVVKKLILAQAATLQLKDVDKDDAAFLDHLKGSFPTEAEFDQRLKSSGITLDDLKKRIHENTLFRKTLEAEAFQNVDPTEQEITACYVQNKDKFAIPDKIRASRVLIVVNDTTTPEAKTAKKKAIDQARARVMKGEDFSKVAREVSEDRYSAPKGGDIGYFQKGENEPAFDDVAFTIKPGVVSPVFQTQLGYQFLIVTDTRPSGEASLADARPVIMKYLRSVKEREAAEAYATKLLADSGVTFHLIMANPTDSAGADSNGAPVQSAPPGGPVPSNATNAPGPQ